MERGDGVVPIRRFLAVDEAKTGDVLRSILSRVYCRPRTRTGSIGGDLASKLPVAGAHPFPASTMMANQIKQNAPNKRSVRFLMFDVSPEGANLWFDISNLVLLAGAVLVAMGTYGTIKFSGIKEKFSDERIAANELETKRAVAESDKANASLEVAKSDIAKANAEAARANERAAELKLALEREIAARQPRTISPQQHDQIVEFLKPIGQKGPVTVVWKQFDEEAARFGKQVVKVLKDSGFDVTEAPGPMAFGEGRGAWIVVRNMGKMASTPTAIGAVQTAFRNILHIEFDGGERKEGYPDVDITIAIGAKP